MIDHELRSKGIGASEIAAICGLDTRRDVFSVWAEKRGKVERSAPNARMRGGKRFEGVVTEWYAESTHQVVQWFDQTLQNPERPWQVFSPDAFVLFAGHQQIVKYEDIAAHVHGGVDAKVASWDQIHLWGESGTDEVPEHVSLQCQWSCSAAKLPWWDVALMAGTDELRVYRIHHDQELEAMLLEIGDKFWHGNVLANVAPQPGPSPATKEALFKMFPRSNEKMRAATDQEVELIQILHLAKIAEKTAKLHLAKAENQVKLAIADDDGLIAGQDKVTWRLSKSTEGVDFEALAGELLADNPKAEELKTKHWKVLKQGSRRFIIPRGWE